MEQMIHNCRPLAAMPTPLQKTANILKRRDQRFCSNFSSIEQIVALGTFGAALVDAKTPRLGPRHQGHLPGSGWIAPGEL